MIMMQPQDIDAASAAASTAASSFTGATSLGLRLVHILQKCSESPQSLILSLCLFVKLLLPSACCCNSRHHGHSFVQEGASATDSDWRIWCCGVFNICESPLWNDHMHAPVACSHSQNEQQLIHLLTKIKQTQDARELFKSVAVPKQHPSRLVLNAQHCRDAPQNSIQC